MNVVVIGANGQLGRDVVSSFAENHDNVASMTHAEIEISKLESVRTCLEECNPAVVVNTAAMHHVENCDATRSRPMPLMLRACGILLWSHAIWEQL